ncbi:MAG: hypothetical protein HQL87_07110 [Magnetococcales bacterium]|nr:hypothetical protein [Magnetococcales bacterium]
MLDWTLQLLNHAWAPWATVGFLLLWGGVHWFALQGHFFRPLHRQLVEMRRQLEETPEEPIAFAARYAEVQESFAKYRLLAPAWSAFSKTLVVSPVRGTPLRGSRDPSHFFNANDLMGREAAQYYYRTIPNLLLGVGVLLTLIGLVAAIHFTIRGMASGDLYATQSALMGLLNAASVKFLSSIAGYSIALFFTWEEKRQKHRLERESLLLGQLWLERIEWTGDDRMGRDQLQETRAQSRHLQEIADRLHQVITQPTFQAQVGKSDLAASQFATSLGQLQETVVTLGETLKTLPAPDLQPLLAHLQQEGARLLQANEAAMERLVGEAGLSPWQRMAGQLEQTIALLNERVAGLGVATPGAAAVAVDMEPLAAVVREEGARLWAAHAETMETLRLALASAGPSQDGWADRLPLLLEQMGVQMEQVIVALGEKIEGSVAASGLEPLLRAVRQEGAQLVRTNEETMRTLVEGVGRRLTEATASTTLAELQPTEREGLLERVAVRMEQAVASLGEVGLAPFFATLRREMEQITGGGQTLPGEALQNSFARIAQQLDSVTAALESKVWAANTLPDMTLLVKAIRGEGERLLQANEQAMDRLLTALAQQAGSGLAVSAGSGLDLEAFFGRMQREGERLVQSSEAAMAGLLREVTQQLAGVSPETVSLLTSGLTQAMRVEGERLQAGQQQVLGQLTGLLAPLAGLPSALSAAPAAQEVVAVLDAHSIQPLLDGWRQEGERLVSANEAAFARLLEEVGQSLAQWRGDLAIRLPAEGASPVAADPAAASDLALVAGDQATLQPVLQEMTRILARQRHEERQLMQQVVSEVNRAVAALDAKIGRATPLNMKTLVNTVSEQGERLFASVNTLAPALAEVTQLMARQRGEEMHLLERVATEVNRSVAALDARIGRATPLQLQTLVDTVNEQGEKVWAGSQEIVRALQAAPRHPFVAPSSHSSSHPEGGRGYAVGTEPVGGAVGSGKARAEANRSVAGTPGQSSAQPSVATTTASPSVVEAVVGASPQGAAGVPHPRPEWSAGVTGETEAVAAEAGLVLAYQSVSVSHTPVQTVPSPWVRSAATGRPPAESRRVWVVAKPGAATVPEVRADPAGNGAPPVLVLALLQEFGATKSRSWQPFTRFVAQQTAEFFDSQERFARF